MCFTLVVLSRKCQENSDQMRSVIDPVHTIYCSNQCHSEENNRPCNDILTKHVQAAGVHTQILFTFVCCLLFSVFQ